VRINLRTTASELPRPHDQPDPRQNDDPEDCEDYIADAHQVTVTLGTSTASLRHRDLARLVRAVSVYAMRMARVNVYLPDDLARQARTAGLNISRVTQDAIRAGLARNETDRWLDRLDLLPAAEVAHERAIEALDDAREDFGRRSS
jgi:post-segregation antitoxin (ccd killing protein)